MEVQAFGGTANGMQLDFAVDKKELTDSAAQYVTVEFIVKNATTSKRTLAELGSHKGIFFFAKATDGSEQEMLGISSGQGLSTFIHNIAPGSNLGIYLRLKKADLQKLAEASAWGEVTVREGEESAAVPIAPFTIHVAITLPR
jgi:hypothetical protein